MGVFGLKKVSLVPLVRFFVVCKCSGSGALWTTKCPAPRTHRSSNAQSLLRGDAHGWNWLAHNYYNWRARCKNGLSDDFGPTFTKPPNYLLSCNVTVAKWIVSWSQHIFLVIWIEFAPKLYQVTLLLARKVKLPKCQEIPIISAGGKKQFCCCPWWMWLKKKIANLTCSNGSPRQEKLFQKLFTLQNGKFCFFPVTLSSATFSD